MGFLSACGAREKNRSNCFLESASAISLVFPGRCFIVMVKLFLAAVRNNLRSRLITLGCFELFPSHACTMGRLSQYRKGSSSVSNGAPRLGLLPLPRRVPATVWMSCLIVAGLVASRSGTKHLCSRLHLQAVLKHPCRSPGPWLLSQWYPRNMQYHSTMVRMTSTTGCLPEPPD